MAGDEALSLAILLVKGGHCVGNWCVTLPASAKEQECSKYNLKLQIIVVMVVVVYISTGL